MKLETDEGPIMMLLPAMVRPGTMRVGWHGIDIDDSSNIHSCIQMPFLHPAESAVGFGRFFGPMRISATGWLVPSIGATSCGILPGSSRSMVISTLPPLLEQPSGKDGPGQRLLSRACLRCQFKASLEMEECIVAKRKVAEERKILIN